MDPVIAIDGVKDGFRFMALQREYIMLDKTIYIYIFVRGAKRCYFNFTKRINDYQNIQ